MTGFDGDAVSLAIYYPLITPADLWAYGTATVGPGVEFPNVSLLPPYLSTDESVDIQGDVISVTFQADDLGLTFPTGLFNGGILTVLTPNAPPITGSQSFRTFLDLRQRTWDSLQPLYPSILAD